MSESNSYPDAEIFFGLVSPVGTDDERVIKTLTDTLDTVRYSHTIIKLSDSLKQINGLSIQISETNEYDRINTLMSKGNELRNTLEDGGALASASIFQIQNYRRMKNGDKSKPIPRQAYILKSLKHPSEVELLRQVYGRSFWLISVYSPECIRNDRLKSKIKETNYGASTNVGEQADYLIQRDQEESDEFGQNVRRTFPLGDVFIDASLEEIENEMSRFIKLVFGYPYHTPTLDEYGMYLAQASALMSSSLARQVGASIMGENGSVISTGTNEVPYVDGGVCNEDFGNTLREFEKGSDFNDKHKKLIIGNFLQLLKDNSWLSESKKEIDVKILVDEVFNNPKLKNAQLMNLTEFGREMHAEMTALMEAARKTISVEDGTLYCTTFPCHLCTKHIVAAGIDQVIFIEPYRKSLAEDLFQDFISVDKKSETENKIEFNPFVGIAPRRYMDLFKWVTRKQKNNEKLGWDQPTSNPRFGEEPPAIFKKEDNVVLVFLEKLSGKKLTIVKEK
ncbi:MAG: hypothetical protein KGI19_10320 [Thaumarchaeota archaeon]|nr:hypothetical protein [Nitrososphaerota archaeon]